MPLNKSAWTKIHPAKVARCHGWDFKGKRVNGKVALPPLKLVAFVTTQPTLSGK